MQQQQQSQEVQCEPVSTVPASIDLVVLNDDMLSHVVGGVTYGPGAGW